MENKEDIVRNWLPRYTGVPLEDFSKYILLTNFDKATSGAWTFNGNNGATDDGFYCSYGLAIQLIPAPGTNCRDDLSGTGRRLLGHAGEAYRVRSGLWFDPVRRTGIAGVGTSA